MKLIDKIVDWFRVRVRAFMANLAKMLNKIFGNKLSPDFITVFGMLAHLPIAYLIVKNEFIWAAVLLIVFGLMDALDGALAREQKRESDYGTVLDASSDRAKEVILYSGVIYVLALSKGALAAVWCIAALGGSFLVSYTKSRGEVAIKNSNLTPAEINRVFADGLMRFELRMFALVIGLFTGYLYQAVIVVAILAWLTAFGRVIRISHKLRN